MYMTTNTLSSSLLITELDLTDKIFVAIGADRALLGKVLADSNVSRWRRGALKTGNIARR